MSERPYIPRATLYVDFQREDNDGLIYRCGTDVPLEVGDAVVIHDDELTALAAVASIDENGDLHLWPIPRTVQRLDGE